MANKLRHNIADASSPACHRVSHECCQPGEVLYAQEPILADDVRVQTSWYVCRGFCYRCTVVKPGSSSVH